MRSQPINILLLTLLLSAPGLPSPRCAPLETSGAAQPEESQSIDFRTYIDANELLMFVSNRGSFAHDRTGLFFSGAGLHYPRDERKKVVYAGGLWIGALQGKYVDISAAEYDFDFAPGPVVDGTYLPDDPSFRVYKIRRGDTRGSNPDYADWPFDLGAPAMKRADGSDSLDTDGRRIPLLRGNQTLWTVFNDTDVRLHTSRPGSGRDRFLGVEVQLMVWCYGAPGPFARTVFMQYTIINESDSTFRRTNVGLWADADVGDSEDDLVGCDSTLGIGYAYNDGADAVYGDAPPAVGFQLLRGLTPRGDPAQMASPALSAFTGWTNGYDPVATQIAYDYLRGRDFNGDNHFDPTTLRYTTYMVPGDPVAPTGWVDDAPGDKRFLVGNGEIDFAPGDTQVVIAAVIVGQGDNPLTSISDLRETAAASRVLFLRGFDTPFPLTLDLQPDRCPNELIDPLHALPAPRPAAADGGNIVPVMLAGSEAFDAIQIDGTSLRLNGLAPLSAAVRYVDTRTLGDSPCDCESSAHDAYADLYLRFDATALFAALAPATNDEHREVTLTGVSKSGFPIIATDCVRLRRFTDAAVGTPRPNDRDHTLEFRNAPNPFNAATVLSITLPEQAFVRVEVFDILGRRVRRLADGAFAAGTTQLTWEGTGDNGRPLPSGVYFARLSTGEKQIYRKLILLK